MVQATADRIATVSTNLLWGDPVAEAVTEPLIERIQTLEDRGTVPTLGTVLMSDSASDERFMALKHETCAELGIQTRDVRLDPTAPARRLYRAVEDLSADPEIDAVFVQVPLPDHVSQLAVRERLEPSKDIDCFHPANLGRLVAGNPRFLPATAAAVQRLLTSYDISVEGADVVIVGRSATIGKPLANLLLRDEPGGNATVTVCHSQTADLAAVTRRADILVTASGVPELIDGTMLSAGVVVVDVSVNRQPVTPDDGRGADGEPPATAEERTTDVVGDVDFDSARGKASAITPVPGGVGPVTLAMLAANVVRAAKRRAGDR